MKKIFKVTNWGDVAFTSDNVSNKTHWLIKALDVALTALDIGEYDFIYNGSSRVMLNALDYGVINLCRPYSNGGAKDTSQPYLIYVDSEKKELFSCSQDGEAKEPLSKFISTAATLYNCARGLVSCNSNVTNYFVSNGGGIRIKFKDGAILGGSIGNIERQLGYASNRNIAQVASPFNENIGVLASPIGQSVSINYHRLALAIYEDGVGLTGWDGSFFESIFLCDKYYIGALASADNTKFIFNGLLFLVDDATDIGIIETTV